MASILTKVSRTQSYRSNFKTGKVKKIIKQFNIKCILSWKATWQINPVLVTNVSVPLNTGLKSFQPEAAWPLAIVQFTAFEVQIKYITSKKMKMFMEFWRRSQRNIHTYIKYVLGKQAYLCPAVELRI